MPLSNDLKLEFKRKAFHGLGLLYMGLYWFLPRWACLTLFSIALVGEGVIEFLRLRRPEVNAWFLAKFGGVHRATEVMAVSGIFWTLAGVSATVLFSVNRRIVMAALGFLVLGDTAAALIGRHWGRHPWPGRPGKTIEGSLAFMLVSFIWAGFFLSWPVALVGAMVGAYIETRAPAPNDNFWIPLLSAMVISVLNLILGRR